MVVGFFVGVLAKTRYPFSWEITYMEGGDFLSSLFVFSFIEVGMACTHPIIFTVIVWLTGGPHLIVLVLFVIVYQLSEESVS